MHLFMVTSLLKVTRCNVLTQIMPFHEPLNGLSLEMDMSNE